MLNLKHVLNRMALLYACVLVFLSGLLLDPKGGGTVAVNVGELFLVSKR
jgi:hypothetical protein